MLGRKIGHEPAADEVLSFLMYPDVFLEFAKARQSYGNVEVLPTPQFYYGMQEGDEIAVELEPGKALVIKFLTVGEPHPDGFRTVFFELNGQPREVNIRDTSLEVKVAAVPKADPAKPGDIGAPMPGVVSTVAVELHQLVKKGDRLLVMEAMKMQSTVYAPVDGKSHRRTGLSHLTGAVVAAVAAPSGAGIRSGRTSGEYRARIPPRHCRAPSLPRWCPRGSP